jgi:hypothetical protein
MSKSRFIRTNVVFADKYFIAAFKAALVFISNIVMPIVASINIISVVVVAVVVNVATDLRWLLRWRKS